MDDYGHGTAVSGIIGAVTNNGKGIAGMDWKAKILPIKVLNSAGEGSISNVNSALAYLASLKSSGINIVAVNMSLGQYTPDGDLQSRCSDAYNQGMVLVAAAGNGDVDWNTYPAYYSTVVAVAATDSSDERSVWTGFDPETHRIQKSNYGDWVDVTAPGSSIYSTNMNGSYSGGWNGTSLASPYVAGLASLLKAANPAMTNAQIIDQIKSTADSVDSLNPGFEGKLGSGRINVYRALEGLSVTARIGSPVSGEVIRGKREIYGVASGISFGCYTLEAVRGGSVETVIKQSSVAVERVNNLDGILGTWETTGLNGDYEVRLEVFATDGTTAVSGETVAVDNTSPEVRISFPAGGGVVEGKLEITGEVRDDHFEQYVLEYGAGAAPTAFQQIGTYYVPVDGSILGTWETSGLIGAYTLRLEAIDRAGNFSSTSEVINIASRAPDREIVRQLSLPVTFALPNPFDRTVTSETYLSYDLAGNFTAVVYIFDLGGNLIWRNSYLPGENGGKAGLNTPVWNGKDLYGESVPNGVYIYQITADGKIIGRGKIAIVN
jgi:hypothetical protein